MKEIIVTLGEKQYHVQQLPVGASRRWREKFSNILESIIAGLETTGQVLSAPVSGGDDLGRMVGQVGKALLGGIGQTLLGSMDTALDMLCEYSPAIAADKETIEENAYDDQVLAGLVEVLKLAFPFSTLGKVFSLGPLNPATKKS